jgi:hypothetical protein
LFRATRAESRPIPIGRATVSGAGRQQALGRLGLGLQSERRLVSATQVGRMQKQAVGCIWPWADIVFLCFYLQNTVFNCFCSDFEQISNSFLYSNYSNESLFREFESDRNISKKFKVNEF